LLDLPEKNALVVDYGTYATAAQMIGWAVGGLFFGVVGDRWGRVKTLSASILVYSLFTGLCGLALTGWDFCLYRFLMGCGIGGAFAAAATLIAETMPDHSRSTAGLFSALSLGT
jgi:MFS family permease